MDFYTLSNTRKQVQMLLLLQKVSSGSRKKPLFVPDVRLKLNQCVRLNQHMKVMLAT